MFDYILVTNKNSLIQHKQAIQGLFIECFDRELDEKTWEWGYLDNVCGSPIVSLCYSKGNLIGHYAVIPISLCSKNSDHKFMLSMTTMVHKDFRRHGLFITQAGLVYAEARKRGYSYIYGFPNKNSLPGFKKRLGWKIDGDDYVALVSKEQLLSSEKFNYQLAKDNDSRFDIFNDDIVNWRLSKPDALYVKRDGIILKEYGDTNDVVYIEKNSIDKLEEGVMYHIFIDGSIPDFLDNKVFSYPFGYLSLTDKFDVLSIKKDLLLSDVF